MINICRLCVLFAVTALLLPAVEDNFNQSSSYLARIRANQSRDWTGNIAVIAGLSRMLNDEWNGADRQPTTGIMLDFGKKGWLANLAIDFKTSSESGQDGLVSVDGTLTEIDLGFRIHIDEETIPWKAYIGGGIAFIDEELTRNAVTISESEIAFWLNAGLYYRINQRWNVGIDLRHGTVADDIEDSQLLRSNYYSYGLMVGYHW
jgi:hypothetical protein